MSIRGFGRNSCSMENCLVIEVKGRIRKIIGILVGEEDEICRLLAATQYTLMLSFLLGQLQV